MGQNLIDIYSLAHFASGYLAKKSGYLKFWQYILSHMSFEYLENTEVGMKFINDNLKSVWLGHGKQGKDAFINIVGDNLSASLGWFMGKY